MIVAVGHTDEVLAEWGDGAPTLDVSGATVLPGLIECHSHPLFAGSRHGEYADAPGRRFAGGDRRRAGGSGQACWRRGGRPTSSCWRTWRSPTARSCTGGVTTLEVKSGYGLEREEELRQLGILQRSRAHTPIGLVITFLGAHVVPAGEDADAYTDEVLEMLPRVIEQGIAQFHDITCERGLFTPAQALRLLALARGGHPDQGPRRRLGEPRRDGAPPWPAGRCQPSI